MLITEHPPHRSQRALLTHWAPSIKPVVGRSVLRVSFLTAHRLLPKMKQSGISSGSRCRRTDRLGSCGMTTKGRVIPRHLARSSYCNMRHDRTIEKDTRGQDRSGASIADDINTKEERHVREKNVRRYRRVLLETRCELPGRSGAAAFTPETTPTRPGQPILAKGITESACTNKTVMAAAALSPSSPAPGRAKLRPMNRRSPPGPRSSDTKLSERVTARKAAPDDHGAATPISSAACYRTKVS